MGKRSARLRALGVKRSFWSADYMNSVMSRGPPTAKRMISAHGRHRDSPSEQGDYANKSSGFGDVPLVAPSVV